MALFSSLVGGISRRILARGMASSPAARPPRALVVCGPSGVGKGTLIERLRQEHPALFGLSVSHTTRGPRPGEEDGVHYHFVTREEIQGAIDAGEMLEHASVHGNMYGTTRRAVERVLGEGKVCVLDIDVQGCRSCRAAGLDGVYAFVSPPSFEELEARLRGRGTETEDRIVKRLGNAAREMQARDEPGLFDHQVVNSSVEEGLEALKAAVKDEVEAARRYQEEARKGGGGV